MHLDKQTNEFKIFFVEKSDFLSKIDFKIKNITLQCTFQIKDKSILSKLDENFIFFKCNFGSLRPVICLKNIGLDNSKTGLFI